jgi:hypothetical protein
MIITSITKKAGAVLVTALLSVGLMACEPPLDNPGKSGSSKKVTVFNDGDSKIGVRHRLKTIRAVSPKANCSWTLMYDLPRGKTVIVARGGAKAAKKGVKLAGPGTLKYRDPQTGKMVTKKESPTSFYSENCGPWRS